MVAVLETQLEGASPEDRPRTAAEAADLLALSRATLEVIERAIRSAPEVRESRVLSRWPLDLEDVLLELEPMMAQTPLLDLAARLGVSSAQIRSAVLRLQRMGLARVTGDGVSLTATGRQKLARLEVARAAVLRRIASRLEPLAGSESRQLIAMLTDLIGRTEKLVEEHLSDETDIETAVRLAR